MSVRIFMRPFDIMRVYRQLSSFPCVRYALHIHVWRSLHGVFPGAEFFGVLLFGHVHNLFLVSGQHAWVSLLLSFAPVRLQDPGIRYQLAVLCVQGPIGYDQHQLCSINSDRMLFEASNPSYTVTLCSR